jgi:hypothetical protein
MESWLAIINACAERLQAPSDVRIQNMNGV